MRQRRIKGVPNRVRAFLKILRSYLWVLPNKTTKLLRCCYEEQTYVERPHARHSRKSGRGDSRMLSCDRLGGQTSWAWRCSIRYAKRLPLNITFLDRQRGTAFRLCLVALGTFKSARVMVKKTWSLPQLSIYGSAECIIAGPKGGGPPGGGSGSPPPGKCSGGNDVWSMWGHGQPHCGLS